MRTLLSKQFWLNPNALKTPVDYPVQIIPVPTKGVHCAVLAPFSAVAERLTIADSMALRLTRRSLIGSWNSLSKMVVGNLM
jgi:hypothetical protein